METKAEKCFDLVTFGEILLRLSAPHGERIAEGTAFQKYLGGAELNVAAGAALLGLRAALISKLPGNRLGEYARNRMRALGVSQALLVDDDAPGARLGLYYYEPGVFPRKPAVVYDRRDSSAVRIQVAEISAETFSQTRMFHLSGISLALGEGMRDVAQTLVRRFRTQGAAISFDVNYRASLWDERQARKTVTELLPLVDVLFVSEETSRRMFQKTGELADILKSYAREYGIKTIACTQRIVHSPSRHDFTSLVYSAPQDALFTEAPYRNIDVVDRVGSGDAYVAGVLSGLLLSGDVQTAMRFGNAAASLKCTVPGDLPAAGPAELTRVMREHAAGGSVSEMER